MNLEYKTPIDLDKMESYTTGDRLYAWTIPPTKSVLHVTPDFRIESQQPKPNRWHRFWYRVLLGWTWSDK